MIEVYLADDMDDGSKTIFLIDNESMYVVAYDKEVYIIIKNYQTADFITRSGLDSEPLDKTRMINPTLIKTFN